MGTLDESDVEKIVDAVKKSRTWKGFYDPKKARLAFNLMFVVAYVGILITGAGWLITWEMADDLAEENEDLVLQSDRQAKEFDGLRELVLDNTDCPSLVVIYHGLHGGDLDLPYTENLIKGEIQFRC